MATNKYLDVLAKSWFKGTHSVASRELLERIDKSISSGQMDNAVVLMKALDALKSEIPSEDDETIDKGRRAARDGEVRSMDTSGNEDSYAQTRHNVRKEPNGSWYRVIKPAPHESINPKDTILKR